MKYCIGVDLGGTNIAAGIVDLDSKKILRKMSIKTRAPRPCDEICDDIVSLCQDLCEKEGLKYSDALWLGVATPGIVKSGVVRATNLGWSEVDFAHVMRKKSRLTTFVANDANAAAYAEATWGAGAEYNSVVVITLGTGVGGGIVVNGEIWEGINGYAAELGNYIIDVDGRLCSCGKRGCLEAYCSATALVSETRRMMRMYPESAMWQMTGGDLSKVNGATPFRAADEGDVCASAVISDFVKYLAVGASNIINILQPGILCIGGGISREGDKLIKPLRREIDRLSFSAEDKKTRIEACRFMNDAGIIGAALLGMQDEIKKENSRMNAIVHQFNIDGEVVDCYPYGNGHINDTRLVTVRNKHEHREYILQKINKNVFKNPALLMENYVNVTKYLRERITEQGGDPDRETLNVLPAKDGKYYYVDDRGDYWRLTLFVKGSVCYDKVERPSQFYDSALAFGNFQYLLRNYPADTLNETIVNFHNTPDRYRQFTEALEADVVGRAEGVKEEIEFVRSRREFMNILEDAHRAGTLPLKVTHNDTKLNNILFDKKTGKALCVIDLDTIMPGYSVNDFGDSIRFGATTALEDERDLSLVNFDISLYEAYVEGFIRGAKGGLTRGEIDLLPIGAIMMTLECGMRFLTDHLSGDTYFKISRENHNLDRARNQFKLVSDMEARLDEMRAIVKKYY